VFEEQVENARIRIVPENLKPFLAINPLLPIIASIRHIAVLGQLPDFHKDAEYSVDWLSNPLFFYIDPDYFTFLLTIAEFVPVVGNQLALALLTLVSTEESRSLIGSVLRLLLEKLQEASQWAVDVWNVAKELTEATLKTALNLMIKYGVKALTAISQVIKYGKATLETAFDLLAKLGEGVLDVINEVAKFGKAMLETVFILLAKAGLFGGAILTSIIESAKISQQALEVALNF